MRIVPHALLAALTAALLLAPGCTRRTPRAESPSRDTTRTSLYAAGRDIVDSIRTDLDLDGIPEFVVTSRDAEGQQPLAPGRAFDRIEVFVTDSAGRWKSVFVDPVESGSRISFEDVTRDGSVCILAYTDGGGNNPVLSHGLNIYGFRKDGSFSVLFFSQEGDPDLRDINGDGRKEIVVTGEYWGIVPHAEAITYTEMICSYDGSAFVPANEQFQSYFTRAIQDKRKTYKKLVRMKADSDEHALDVHRAFAEWVLWLGAWGDLDAVRSAWNSERDALGAILSEDEYDDLDGIVQDIIAEPPPSNAPARTMS